MVNKRGVSSVVTVAFIILGTILGLALLWSFVTKTTNSKSGEVVDPDCLTISLEMVDCKAYGICDYYFGSGGYEANVLVKRNPGQGNVTGLRFIFENEGGRKGTYDVSLNNTGKELSELGSVQFVQPYSIPVQSENPHIIRVAALMGKNKDVCPITSNSARCPIINTPPIFGEYANNTEPGSFPASNRIGNCCQWPKNLSVCYDGGDLNYPFDSNYNLVNGLPPGNYTVCCQNAPY